MSKALRPSDGAVWTDGIATVHQHVAHGMITVRADLNTAPIKAAITSATGVAIPAKLSIETGAGAALCWMSPDELLVLCDADQAGAVTKQLQEALAQHHALVANMSDARVIFSVSGAQARDVVSKLVPVDLSPDTFKPGMLRRTRLAQVAAGLWMPDDDTICVLCFRSVSEYAHTILKQAAQAGSSVFRR